MRIRTAAEAIAATLAIATSAVAAEASPPPAAADVRVANVVRQLTRDEKLQLVKGQFGATLRGAPPPFDAPPPAGALGTAGFVKGIERLGVPDLHESDAGLGVANIGHMRPGDEATALPSGLSQAAGWDPDLAEAGGAMIGAEAASRGYNVLLAGAVNLTRDPRNGRNFEYAGEDPLLAGVLVGAAIKGIQSQGVISTAKHFAANDQETGRNILDARIGEKALRETDLLAFELALEIGRPGAIMCAYNRINGDFACENEFLLNQVLKRDWGYRGWVMSDWGGVHSTVKAALNGLDQQSAYTFDREPFFGDPLKAALASGQVPESRLDDMAHRIIRSVFAVGVDKSRPRPAVDQAANAALAQRIAEQGVVLLKNDGDILPLAASARRIAVIGGHADLGVMSGGGSSQVMAYGGVALELSGKPGPLAAFDLKKVYHPSSPLKAIRALAPGADVTFAPGDDVAKAVSAARDADVVIVFADQWQTETLDSPSLALPDSQDALIAAVAAVNPRTIVVLETGNPVTMPWLAQTPAVLEAWYLGQRGGEAIANILFGRVSPSGKLPMTFPAAEAQLPRPTVPGAERSFDLFGAREEAPLDVTYSEGSAVGYKWFEAKDLKPLFPFGHGLSYSRFGYEGLTVQGGPALRVAFSVQNIGARPAAEVAQVYARPAAGGVRRLVGWRKVFLQPGESRRVDLEVDPRLIAEFDVPARQWRIAAGDVEVEVGASSADTRLSQTARLAAKTVKP